ncbi:MAG TPA: RagB/SusD family nutrient uptake outer membrane protein, partial [Puia sp.]|nr:RagB/SusD family nutrient uptake outer membrane protein [Puia sp.]
FDRLQGSSTNSSLPAEWNGPWQTINAANYVLAGYQNIVTTDTVTRNNSAGQAYFLRGLCYYYLVRTFGPLPLVLVPQPVTVKPPRADVSAVYAQIISDLTAAKNMLSADKVQGKPSKYSASAILADVYLTMAGWPLNDATKYQSAAAEAQIVMSSGKYDATTPYDQIFKTRNSSEVIFGLEYSVAGNLPNRRFGSSNVPLDEVAVDGSSGWDDVYPEINFYKNRPICSRSYWTFYDTIKLRNPDKLTFTLVPWNSPATHAQHPYYKKYRAGLVTNGVGDGVNEDATHLYTIQPSTNAETIISRYAGVLLDFAEASNMASGGPTADSYAAINQVRTRAGLPNLTPGLSQTAFRDSVV